MQEAYCQYEQDNEDHAAWKTVRLSVEKEESISSGSEAERAEFDLKADEGSKVFDND